MVREGGEGEGGRRSRRQLKKVKAPRGASGGGAWGHGDSIGFYETVTATGRRLR